MIADCKSKKESKAKRKPQSSKKESPIIKKAEKKKRQKPARSSRKRREGTATDKARPICE